MVETLKSLFSFRGEIGRGAFWGTVIALSLVSAALEIVLIVVGNHTGETIFDPMNRPFWPHSPTGIAILVYWFFQIAFMWVFIAALVKRLRDVGIALKWLAIFVPVFALYGAAFAVFIPEGTTHPSTLGIMVVSVAGLPAYLMMLWLFGSAFFARGGKPRYFDPDKLPEGWKK